MRRREGGCKLVIGGGVHRCHALEARWLHL
ncbi:hypothetical protein J2T15_004458 [Paenibacillus harenae]|uniref:Uncharacterized protein n=1 Tax=Paenibacillus harenae TaxID=306543 RepID=A0ABT9U7I6_PAEHA|nr:hypothetical protein [Paenibacillus harenae]